MGNDAGMRSVREQPSIVEIAPGIHRIACYHQPSRCTINQFLIAGAEPALVSTGLRTQFEAAWEGIATLVDPATLRSIVVLHTEADECGALNDFLARAPQAVALGSMRTVMSSLADVALRPPRGLGEGEVISTGTHHLRVFEAPYVHAWDGIMLVDEEAKVVFTGDLFAQPGMTDAVSNEERAPLAVQFYRTMYGVPPEAQLRRVLDWIESVPPRVLAPGHGPALTGNLAPYFRAFRALASDARAALGAETAAAR